MNEATKNQLSRFFPGVIVYKYLDDGTLIQKRIKQYKESNDTFYMDTPQGGIMDTKYDKIHSKEILDEWTILNPQAIITFNIVKLQSGKDIIVGVHPLKEQSSIPAIVCRQSIIDIFSDMAYKSGVHYRMTGEQALFVGMCISQSTCPENINYEITLACESVEHCAKVAYYIEDDLRSILRYVRNIKKFNQVLTMIKQTGLNQEYKNVSGYNDTLEELLRNTSFIVELHKYFNIHEVPTFFFKPKDHETVISMYDGDERFEIIESIIEKKLSRIYIFKYTRDLDLSMIVRDYTLMIESVINQVYIVAYDVMD